MCTFYRALILWCLLSISGGAWTQTSKVYTPSVAFTKRDGLDQNQVVNLVEDKFGRIWIGTQNGISVFDGRTVRSCGQDRLKLDGAIRYLNIDGKGRLWGATNSHFFIYDGLRTLTRELTIPYKESIYYLSLDGEPALSNTMGDQIFRDGKLLPLADVYTWLHCYGPVRELRQWKSDHLFFYLPGRDTMQIYDRNRRLKRSVSLWENGKYYEPFTHSFDGRSMESVFRSRQDPENLYQYDVVASGFKTTDRPLFLEFLRTSPSQWRLNQSVNSSPDSLFRLFRWSGISAFSVERDDGQTEVFALCDSLYRAIQVKRPFYSRTQLLDHSGQRLFSGSDDGLNVFFLNGWLKYDIPSCGNPWSVLPSTLPDRLWLSCHKVGFLEIDKEGNEKNKRPLPLDLAFPTDRQLFPGKWVGPQGNLYSGGYRGVYRLTEKRIDHWKISEAIEAIIPDPQSGRMLAAGVHIFLLPSNPLREIRDTIFVPKVISTGTSCTDLMISPLGDTIWISGWGGIGRFDRRLGKWTVFTQENGRYPFQGAFSFGRTDDQRIWCGGSNGLSVWDPVSDYFLPVLKDVISSQISQVITPSPDTMLVIGSQAMWILDIGREPVRLTHRFDDRSGYTVLEPNENGAYLDDDDQLWIPSIDGIHRFDYAHLSTLKMPGHVLLIDQINGKPISLTRQHLLRDTLRESVLEIHTWLIGPEGNRAILEYRIDEGQWRASRSPDRLLLDELDHGHRNLSIRARIPGLEPKLWPVLSGEFWVILPIWKRKDFQSSMIAVAIFLFIVVIMAFIERIQSRRQLKAVNQQLQETRLRTIQAQLNPHFLFNAMTTLQNTIQNRTREEASDQLVQLSRLIRQVLELSVQQNHGMASLPLTSLSQELELLNDYVELEQSQRSPGFVFVLDVQEELREDDPMVPPLMIQPVVENAIQHGLGPLDRVGHVWVNVTEEVHQIHYRIEDDGIGREAAARLADQKIFRHRSHGVELLHERVSLLNDLGYPSQLVVMDGPSGGTIVDIYITLPS